MEESAKETVIIVHGSWAMPKPGMSQWYQPVDGVPVDGVLAVEGFIAKLDAALHERGSPARCWAHCVEGNQIFQWSGENSWIARIRAASALGDYVARLGREGWHCHVVAHSHGGNIVVDALQQNMTAHSLKGAPSKIVTLGTPFMDTMSPILNRAKRDAAILSMITWISYALVMLWLLFISAIAVDWGGTIPFIIFVFLSVLALFFRRRSDRTGRTHLWETANGATRTQPPMLAIGSPMDEAWQILHHMRNIDNPLAIKSNPLSYLFSALKLHLSREAEVARIHGAKSSSDLGSWGRLFLNLVLTPFFFGMVVLGLLISVGGAKTLVEFAKIALFAGFILYCLVLFLTRLLGETFYSALSSPYRRFARLVNYLLLGGLLTEIATYVARRKGWSVMVAISMGLEGYPYPSPVIEQNPSYVPENIVIYEHMPKCAEDRALNERSAWISRHFGNVSQTFAKMTVTAADITSLLRIVEADQSLVHGAYYTADECIARIADWISGRG